jgi:hypothetical protein
MLLGATGYLLLGLGPLAAVLFGSGPARWFGALAVSFLLFLHLRGTREAGVRRRAALLYPLMAVVLAWIVIRAMVLTLWQGGIVWRGTFYSLSELRRNRV